MPHYEAAAGGIGKKGREAPHRPSLGGKKPLPRQEKVLQETGKSAAAIRKKDCGSDFFCLQSEKKHVLLSK